ncbi:MAG: ABC transporter permease [Promethearchaeota archaeon]
MNISGLIRKEFGRIKSDRRTLILLFFIPFILILIFGLTTGGGPTAFFNAAIISRDEISSKGDFSSDSDEYDQIFISIVENNCSAFGLYKSFNSTNELEYNYSIEACKELLKNELIDVFIVLPANFSESVKNEVDPVLIYYVDGSDLNAVNSIEVAIQEPIALFRIETDLLTNFTTMSPYMEFDVPFWESQILNYAIPMLISMIIIGTTMNLTSLSIVAEGPLPRMLLTPAAKREVIASKLIAYSVIMILQSTEIFVMTAFFGLYCLGSLLDFYLSLIVIGFCGISMGLFISAISTTEQAANQLYIMMFIIIILFSGQFVSLSQEIRPIIYFLPLSHAIPLITEITLKGFSINLEHVLSLGLISLIFISLAYIIYRFKKVEV